MGDTSPTRALTDQVDAARHLVGGCRAVIFDLDDTLLATREVKWAHHKAVAAECYGINLTDADLELHWGKPFDEMITLLYRSAAPLEQLRSANLALESKYLKHALDGAVDLVEHLLADGVEVGVLTSTNTIAAATDLARTGFPVDQLLFVHGADLTVAHKPDPAVFQSAVETLAGLGIDKSVTAYIGDAIMDLVAARGAGLRFVGVTTGLVTAAQFSSMAACWIPTVQQLITRED